MPLDALGCTRTTLTFATSIVVDYFGFRSCCTEKCGEAIMDVSVRIAACKGSMNEECLVSALQHSALNTPLLFVHTARRIKELN